IVAQRECRRTRGALWKTTVMRDAGAWPQRQAHAALQIEEGDCAMFKLLAHDAVGLQPQPVAIEVHCPLQIPDAQCDDRDTWFHRPIPPVNRTTCASPARHRPAVRSE